MARAAMAWPLVRDLAGGMGGKKRAEKENESPGGFFREEQRQNSLLPFCYPTR